MKRHGSTSDAAHVTTRVLLGRRRITVIRLRVWALNIVLVIMSVVS